MNLFNKFNAFKLTKKNSRCVIINMSFNSLIHKNVINYLFTCMWADNAPKFLSKGQFKRERFN